MANPFHSACNAFIYNFSLNNIFLSSKELAILRSIKKAKAFYIFNNFFALK